MARWVEKHIPEQSTADALWILRAALRRSSRGLVATICGKRCGCRLRIERAEGWAKAIWEWWEVQPKSVSLTIGHMDTALATEDWLATNAPADVGDALVDVLAAVCRDQRSGRSSLPALGSGRPLAACVEKLRANATTPDAALDTLLVGRSAAEIVDSAAATNWPPLTARAVHCTLAEPELLARAVKANGVFPLLSRHLSEGGTLPKNSFERISSCPCSTLPSTGTRTA